jgi:GAF domain-containing protein
VILRSPNFSEESWHVQLANQPTSAVAPRPAAGEWIVQVCESVRQMARAGAPALETLSRLVSAAEELAGAGAVASILVIDQEGFLRNGASPKLPSDYLQAIDGLKPDPSVGTCAAAAATGLPVMTPSFFSDEKWAELRHLPMALGFAGAWSVPIKSPAGKVLGTFGTYFTQPRLPTPEEQSGVAKLAAVAAMILLGG